MLIDRTAGRGTGAGDTGSSRNDKTGEMPGIMTTWFITGCSTGLGRELATAALAAGDKVAATARDPSTISDLTKAHEPRAMALALDVTDSAQVRSAVRSAEGHFGEIDVLVNNAGYGFRGAVEEASDEEIRQLFETNVFGLVAVTQAVLPGMRRRRRGHIINISSTAGRMAHPGSGFYSATKFAVGGLSDALRKEVNPLGIHVTVVEPSGFRTDFAGRSLHQSKQTIDDYDSTAGARRKERVRTHGKQPGDPVRAAAVLMEIARSPTPPFRLALGRGAVTRIRAELADHIREIDQWAALSNSADYPVGGA
jgi:NADP-dependent 3-hydroxy acid dehydrogenase YdfG